MTADYDNARLKSVTMVPDLDIPFFVSLKRGTHSVPSSRLLDMPRRQSVFAEVEYPGLLSSHRDWNSSSMSHYCSLCEQLQWRIIAVLFRDLFFARNTLTRHGRVKFRHC